MIKDRIEELKGKRRSGKKLTDKEIIELSRLIRTLASRNYRSRQNQKLDHTSNGTSSQGK